MITNSIVGAELKLSMRIDLIEDQTMDDFNFERAKLLSIIKHYRAL